MLRSRVITAFVALPPLLAILIWGPDLLVGLLFLAIGLLAWQEFSRVAEVGQSQLRVGRAFGLVLLHFLTWGPSDLAWPVAAAGFGAVMINALIAYRLQPEALHRAERAWLGLGLIYLPLGFMAHLALGPDVGLDPLHGLGRWWLIYLLINVFAADTGAYFVGRAWGRSKFYPQVSPGKTWAGVWGGLSAGALVGLGGGWLSGGPVTPLTGLVTGLAVAAASIVGDLLISLLKRTYNTKDAGSLLPGHGGFLDRLDSFILSAPVLYGLLWLWGR